MPGGKPAAWLNVWTHPSASWAVVLLIALGIPRSYAGITALPPGFVSMVKKYNPHITELELSRQATRMQTVTCSIMGCMRGVHLLQRQACQASAAC